MPEPVPKSNYAMLSLSIKQGLQISPIQVPIGIVPTTTNPAN